MDCVWLLLIACSCSQSHTGVWVLLVSSPCIFVLLYFLVLDSATSTPSQWIRQTRPCVYLKEGKVPYEAV